MSKVNIHNVYGRSYAATNNRAVLLINLGSPRSPKVKDVASYLREFLMDERVISLSPFWRSVLVKGIIVPFRAKRSARNYSYIWDEEQEVFPLVHHSALLAEALSEQMKRPVGLAMRYGTPSMDDTLRELSQLGVKEVSVLPLYPHYTRSSFETAAVHALDRLSALGLDMELSVMDAFYEEEAYNRVLVEQVRRHLPEDIDRLIISMHGIPVSHLMPPCRSHNGETKHCIHTHHTPQQRATCYRLHCETSAERLRQDLGLPESKVELVYQSRLGNHEWMRPYFIERVKSFAAEGAKRIAVVCPGFICDCLETLHEIDVEYRRDFMHTGGHQMTYIPCLNSSPELVEALSEIIYKHEKRL